MHNQDKKSEASPGAGLSTFVAIAAVGCWVGAPLIAGLLGSITLGAILGAGVAAVALCFAAAWIVARLRREQQAAPVSGSRSSRA